MTLAQIMRLALRQLDEDPADIDDFRDLFIEYANEGYLRAVNDYLKPRHEFVIVSDAHGDAVITGWHIRSIVSARPEEFPERETLVDIGEDGRCVHVHDRCLWEHPIRLLCRIEFPPLVEDTDEPRLPKEAHLALADYICYRYKSTGNLAKQSQAQPYLSMYMSAMAKIESEAAGSCPRYKNLYAATSRRWPF